MKAAEQPTQAERKEEVGLALRERIVGISGASRQGFAGYGLWVVRLVLEEILQGVDDHR